MSPTQKLRLKAIRRAGPTGLLAAPDRTFLALEGKKFIRSEIDPDRVLALRYYLTEKCQ